MIYDKYHQDKCDLDICHFNKIVLTIVKEESEKLFGNLVRIGCFIAEKMLKLSFYGWGG